MRKNSQNECNVGGGLTGVHKKNQCPAANNKYYDVSGDTLCNNRHAGYGVSCWFRKKDLIIMKKKQQKQKFFLTLEKK